MRSLTRRIPVAGPWITDREVRYAADAAATAWYDGASVYPAKFEARFAEYVGRRYAVALPSCTSAIHLCLAGLGVGPGDEVIVPELTWIATSAPVSYVGARPVFADIDRKTWCLSAESLEEKITERTKAVIPVDLYGSLPNMDAIRDVAARFGIAVIEDAAEAIGSRFRGKISGSFGVASVFSFHGSKTLTTGEGGMAVTDDGDLYDRILVLRDHGRRPGDVRFFNEEVGMKYKMSALQAAVGLAQLERVEELLARKRAVFEWYREGLGDFGPVSLNPDPAEADLVHWMVTVVFDESVGMGKERAGELLSERGIDTRPFFHPLSSLPAYSKLASAATGRRANPESYRLSCRGLNLPSALCLTEDDVETVVAAVKEIVPT